MLKIAGQLLSGLRVFDSDTQLLFLRFVMRAAKSTDPNRFVREALEKVLDEVQDELPLSPRQVRVTVKEVKR